MNWDVLEGFLRIAVLNFGGFPVDPADPKNAKLRQYIADCSFDIVALLECNIHWQSLPIAARLPERTFGWFESQHMNSAYFRGYPTSEPSQVGGVSVWSLNQAAHRVMQTGEDPKGLGRWAWTRFRGRNGLTFRFVAAYRPVLNKTGALSVWNQQKTFLLEHGDTRCPRQVFLEDLLEEIKQWKDEGDQIAISVIANEDVRSEDACSFSRKLREMGLVEAITTAHGKQGPPTYERGSEPIDGIFVSETLLQMTCGYLPFVFDHRALYIDVPLSVVFGHELPPVVRPQARRLKCDDPRIVKRYQDTYWKQAVAMNLPAKVAALHQEIMDWGFDGTRPLTGAFGEPL